MSMNDKLFLLGLQGCESMGEEEVPDVPEVEVPTDLPTTPEEIEDQTAELVIAESNNEIIEQAAVVEQLAETVEAQQEVIEEVVKTIEGLEAFLGAGAYNPQVAAMLYDQARNLDAKLTGRHHGEFMGAEALADETTAVMAMRGGMESFLANAKAAAKKGVDFIKEIFNQAIEFIKSLFSKAEGIKRRAAGLEKQIAAKDKLKEEIELGKWNLYINVEKEGPKASDNVGSVFAVIDAIKDLVATKDAMISGVSGGKEDVSAFASKYAAIAKPLNDFVGPATKKESKQGVKNTIAYVTGARRILVTLYTGEIKTFADVQKAAKTTRIQISMVAGDVKTSGKVKAPITDKANLINLVKASAQMADVKEASFTAAERNKAIGAITQLESKDSPLVPKLVPAIKSMYAMAASVETAINKYNLAKQEARLSHAAAYL